MLDIPKLGISRLNHALEHIAAHEESGELYSLSEELIEDCKLLLEPGKVRDYIRAQEAPKEEVERTIMRSLSEAHTVRRMR